MKKLSTLKILVIILIFTTILTTTSCGTKTFSIYELENILQDTDEDVHFNIKEEDTSYYFSYSGIDSKYSGKANKKEQVIAFDISYEIKINTVQNKSKMQDILDDLYNGDYWDLTGYDINAAMCFAHLMSVGEFLGANMSVDEYLEVFCNNKTLNIENWNISSIVSEAEQTITISFKIR